MIKVQKEIERMKKSTVVERFEAWFIETRGPWALSNTSPHLYLSEFANWLLKNGYFKEKKCPR